MADSGKICGGADFYGLPEGCIAAVISVTTPRDACCLATVSTVFKSAADSDSVWERFLPSDFSEVLARSSDGRILLDSLSKKQLYLRLADRPLLIDGGTKSFSLVKSSGKKCYMIAARNLEITWSDTPRYWRWATVPGSRFPEVAELITVCWFEIRGKIRTCMLSPSTTYAAYLVFKMTEEAYGFSQSAEVSLGVSGVKIETRNVYLDTQEGETQRLQIIPRRIRVFNRVLTPIAPITRVAPPRPRVKNKHGKYPNQRADGWLEVEIGEFFNRREEGDGEVEMSVAEVKAGNWKGGIVVGGIEVRPKGVKR